MKFQGIRELGQRSYFIILIFLILAALMVSSGLMELSQSRKNLYQLMESQSFTLLESIMIASHNSLLSNEYLEELSRKRLLDNAHMIRSLFEDGSVNDALLENYRGQTDLYSIRIISPEGRLLHSCMPVPAGEEGEGMPELDLSELFSGESDTLIIGLRRTGEVSQYMVALAASEREAIVVSFDAQRFLDFRRSTGFGILLNEVADENRQIRYIAFQDQEGILAATGNVTSLEAIEASPFLSRSLSDSLYLSRVTAFDGQRIFEVTHPFTYQGESIGLIRMGLSTEPLREINRRIFRNMIISTVVLVFVGFILITYLFIRQRLSLVQKRYHVVESYSAGIIEHVSDAILVYDRDQQLRIFNAAAEKLFIVSQEEALAGTLSSLFSPEQCDELFQDGPAVRQISCRISGQLKHLLLSRSSFRDRDGLEYVILVLRDLSEQKKMEEQVQRTQRLSAMGELASGVAHEIRNPLNAIGTIVQQLRTDFIPQKDQEEFAELTGIVYKEVKRINKTIQDFLRFSRPEPVIPEEFDPRALLEEIGTQYSSLLKERQIDLETRLEWEGSVSWDRNQIKQVLINLLQNAMEAIGREGRVSLVLSASGDDSVRITVSDDGPGMDEKTRENLFNLYFTTKASGTGIGLSLVQRIVYEHRGVISFESEKGSGTSFTIQLPVRVEG